MNVLIEPSAVTELPVFLAVSDLRPHPKNPRFQPNQSIVDEIAEITASDFDVAHALLVRKIEDGYQIVSGHHRWLAARKAGLTRVPCWIREMSDKEAYLELVRCNKQSELHPLEEGKHAAESGLDLKAYAAEVGKDRSTLARKLMAWRVFDVCHVAHAQARDHWRNLAEIHAAPEWLWEALAARMLEKQWTVKKTRAAVADLNLEEPPGIVHDYAAIGEALISGAMSRKDYQKILDLDAESRTWTEEIWVGFQAACEGSNAWKLSDIMSYHAIFAAEEAKLMAELREEELAEQRKREEAIERVQRLRENVSLEEWKTLEDSEKSALLAPAENASGSFNKQKSADIEWAQWSWNPVTGCKHDCPYCYARDIANQRKMEKLYPNGFAPTFRSNALSMPSSTTVPKIAEQDARYRNVFTCSMADLFGRWVPKEWIDTIMHVIGETPQWNFLFLTKFPQRLREFDIPNNAWMGTTVDLQARVKNAEKAFENVNGKVRWLSVEPMIEPLTFERLDLFDWLVIGGASRSERTPEWKPPYRWIENLVRQADDAGIPVYMKSNLGIANRILELPFNVPVKLDPQTAPEEFSYLGGNQKP